MPAAWNIGLICPKLKNVDKQFKEGHHIATCGLQNIVNHFGKTPEPICGGVDGRISMWFLAR